MKINIKIILRLVFLLVFLAIVEITSINLSLSKTIIKEEITKLNDDYEDEITVSFVGDCTIGTGANYGYRHSFIEKYDQVKDDSYFLGGVKDVLGHDTFTIANLEVVLSDKAKTLNPKQYNYKGPTKYVNILTKGSVELVNVANNHTYDYLEQGYQDTLSTLKKANVLYFGYNNYQIVEAKGIRFGIAGIPGWDYSYAKSQIDKAMDYFKNMHIDKYLFNFHWGDMRVYNHNKTQERIAKYAIDKGADLVVGHHPHVIQGLEKYKGKNIAYSIGNFLYGGIYYPYDSDTMIIQMHYVLENNTIKEEKIEIIPASITSSRPINDYRPQVLTGKEKTRVLKKILKYSKNFNYSIDE